MVGSQLCAAAFARQAMSSTLGSRKFDANCEVVDAAGCGVTGAECAVFGARIKSGEFKALTTIYLVRLFSFILVPRCLGAESLQSDNQIGDAGACSIGEGLKCNSSVRELNLVSCGV